MEDSDKLTIDCVPSGRNGSATLTAKLAGELLAVESVNLTKPKAEAHSSTRYATAGRASNGRK